MTIFHKMALLASILGVMILTFTSTALANSNPATTVISSSVTPTIMGASASASDVATGRVTVLADVMMKVGVKITRKNCKQIAGGWWNSGRDTNGQLKWFRDPYPATVCRSTKSPTGWVKVAGGLTGRKCFNPAKVNGPAPGKVVKGRVLMVVSYAKVKVQLQARAKVGVTAVCGYAEGSASANVTISFVSYVRSRGKVNPAIFSEVLGKATANASAKLECKPAAPVPPPPVVTPPPPVVVSPPPPPPPPGKGKVTLVKYAFVDGSKVSTPSGFGFAVNGFGFSNTGEVTNIGDFQVGTSVTICETNPMGWTADKSCETQTVSSGGNTFVFTNRKTTPPPPPPPAPQPPALVNQVNPEEIFADGETYPNICVTVLGKSGNSITVVFGATYGSFAVSTVTITSAGTNRVCTTYKAPNDSSVVGKSEVITYDAVDNTTGLRAQQVQSQPVPIKAAPANP